MAVIKTRVKTDSDQFKANKEHYLSLTEELRSRLEEVKQGGPEHMREKHEARGKLFVRERIRRLCDPDTFFLELSPLAAWDMYDNEVPAAGIITGIGIVCGKEVMIIANDATVKGGSYHPMTVKKHVRAQEIAMQNHLPTIYLVDSGGAFLPMQDEVFPDSRHFGRFFFNQAQLSAKGIPQICAVMGMCIAGGAYMPAMSDDAAMVRKQGTIYIGGPPLVKAATGEEVDSETLGGADTHCRISGVADYYALNDDDAIRWVRDVVANLNRVKRPFLEVRETEEPLYDAEEMYGIIPQNIRQPFDIREIIARIVDGSRLHEFKALYGMTIVCGWAHIMGYPVGIIANNGVIFPESAMKAAHFIELAAQRRIPLVYLHNITGFMVGSHTEHGGLPKHGAKFITATATANVPKFSVMVGASVGAGNYAMCGRGYDPNLLLMWPSGYISVMGGEQATGTLRQIRIAELQRRGETYSEEYLERILELTLEDYRAKSTPYYSTAHLWDDGVIDPVDTRRMLGFAISASLNAPIEPTRFGVFRM